MYLISQGKLSFHLVSFAYVGSIILVLFFYLQKNFLVMRNKANNTQYFCSITPRLLLTMMQLMIDQQLNYRDEQLFIYLYLCTT